MSKKLTALKKGQCAGSGEAGCLMKACEVVANLKKFDALETALNRDDAGHGHDLTDEEAYLLLFYAQCRLVNTADVWRIANIAYEIGYRNGAAHGTV